MSIIQAHINPAVYMLPANLKGQNAYKKGVTVFVESNNIIIRTISFNVVMILSLPTENILPYPNANINFMFLMKRWITIVINFIMFLRVVISETSANIKDN